MFRKFISISIAVSILCLSCCTGNIERDSEVLSRNIVETVNGIIYEFKGNNNNTLVFYLEGSGLHSVLGVKDNDGWSHRTFSFFVIKYFKKFADVVIIEKPGMKPGKDHSTDSEVLAAYTSSNLIDHYSVLIDDYLDKSDAEQVVIFGYSEGGMLAPAVYRELKNRDRIKKLVIGGAGGMSQYEQFMVLAESYVKMPGKYRVECRDIQRVRSRVRTFPDSIEFRFLGLPYRRWNSFFDFSPADYYANIEIPVLFYHGTFDWSVPVESTSMLEKLYPDKNFVFMYIDKMQHVPEDDKGMDELFMRLIMWVTEDNNK
ncbi:MAG: alpha/beta hydrolase [Spirochaetes bacterium]|nr:alpha/beta hydrolase [Spirochaetota bacterium]MBN2772337.1 alpha/beta hydrolase [Spirochaetota bacterium]